MQNTIIISQCGLVYLNRGQTAVERKWFFILADVCEGGSQDEALRTSSAWEATEHSGRASELVLEGHKIERSF